MGEADLTFKILWGFACWFQVVAMSALGFACGRNIIFRCIVIGVSVACSVACGWYAISHIVAFGASLIGFGCLVALGVQKLSKLASWRQYLLLSAGVWAFVFQTMYLFWWRSSCNPKGPVPDTWPEDALFSCEFNHNAWYHVCYIVWTLMIAVSHRARV